MNNYKVVVYVNGRRSELTVSARIMSDMKEIVKVQFADAKLSFWYCNQAVTVID